MEIISVEQIKLFHHKIIISTGGTGGVRNEELIDSAINRGLSSFDGKYLYKSNIEKISAITHSLISNHAFTDGNKRIGIAVMLLLLKLNNISIKYTQQEVIDLGLGVASSKYKFKDIISWIKNHEEQ